MTHITTAEKHDSFFLMSIDYLLDSIKQPSGKKIPFYIPYFSGDKSLKAHLGKDPATKSDDFLEKFQRGGGHFQSKKLYCRY